MRVLAFIITVLLFAQPVYATEKTLVRDKGEAAKLLGRHLFTGGAISGQDPDEYRNFGVAEIINDGGVYRLSAEHEHYYPSYDYDDKDGGGYIRLFGNILEINKNIFYLNGSLEYYEHNFNKYGDRLCKKDGQFLLARNGHPAYWRVQSKSKKNITCTDPINVQGDEETTSDSVIHYIDIFTTPLEGEPPNGRRVKR